MSSTIVLVDSYYSSRTETTLCQDIEAIHGDS